MDRFLSHLPGCAVVAAVACAAPASAAAPVSNGLHVPALRATAPEGPWPTIARQLLAGGVLTGLAFAAEDPELAAVRLERVDGLSDLDFVGDGYFMAGAIASAATYGHLRGRPGARNLARDLLKAWAITGAAVGTIKITVNRTRPNGGAYSFPSGHTATAFMAAPVLAEHFGWKVGIPAYLVASSVGLGRMEDRKHFLSDVVAGAAIGIAAGTYVAFGRSRVRLEADPRSLALATDW